MTANADKRVKELAYMNQYKVDNKGPYFFKINNDPRITRVGKFLRETNLDELSALLNIVKGIYRLSATGHCHCMRRPLLYPNST